jgi:tRNA (cytidine/uridine-2'-O-)-methyltransferase
VRRIRLESQTYGEEAMFHVALWEPEIAANTGNIGRLCVGAGATLHVIGPTRFRLDERAVRRAGVDHWRDVQLLRHTTLAEFEAGLNPERIFCFSARATTLYARIAYQPGDALLFGSESRGLPPEVVQRYGDRAVSIPLPGGKVRSLNLANAVAVALYEALRQVQGW